MKTQHSKIYCRQLKQYLEKFIAANGYIHRENIASEYLIFPVFFFFELYITLCKFKVCNIMI